MLHCNQIINNKKHYSKIYDEFFKDSICVCKTCKGFHERFFSFNYQLISVVASSKLTDCSFKWKKKNLNILSFLNLFFFYLDVSSKYLTENIFFYNSTCILLHFISYFTLRIRLPLYHNTHGSARSQALNIFKSLQNCLEYVTDCFEESSSSCRAGDDNLPSITAAI